MKKSSRQVSAGKSTDIFYGALVFRINWITGAKLTMDVSIFYEPLVDHSLVSLHEHAYKPYGSPTYRNSDVIKIPINFQDVILDISNSYIYIEAQFTPNNAANLCYLSNNPLAFRFNEI